MFVLASANHRRIRLPADFFFNGLFLTALLMLLSGVSPILANSNPTACINEYDEDIDYFPDKVDLQIAEGFSVQYFNHYKLVEVLQPWTNASEADQESYLLVQCGTPIPSGYEDVTQVVEIPVRSLAALSTTHLPYLPIFNAIDKLVAVSALSTVNTPEVRAAAEEGDILELSPNYEFSFEAAVTLQPDLTMTYGFGFETDDYHRLRELGLTVVLNGEFAENSPLARAEWGKFIALFLNAEAAAEASFDKTHNRYEELQELAAKASERPTVFLNSPYQDVWYMAGGNSFMAQFLADAGADYLWADDESTGSLFLDFETVFEKAANADYWLNVNQYWFTEADTLAEDGRYANFAAFAAGNVYSNNLAINETFGNDFFESGAAFPDLILQDLILILHPEMLSGIEKRYYRRLYSE